MNKTTAAETRRLMETLKEMKIQAEKIKESTLLDMVGSLPAGEFYSAAELSEMTGLPSKMIAVHLNKYTKASRAMKYTHAVRYSSKSIPQTFVKLNDDGTVDMTRQVTLFRHVNTYGFERKMKNAR